MLEVRVLPPDLSGSLREQRALARVSVTRKAFSAWSQPGWRYLWAIEIAGSIPAYDSSYDRETCVSG